MTNSIEASELTRLTQTPGIVFSIPIEMLPSQLQKMPGATSYFSSGYLENKIIGENLTIGGEIVVARTEEGTAKAYNYMIATSGDGNVYFNGPYKDFENHHYDKSSSIPIESLFGHTPFS